MKQIEALFCGVSEVMSRIQSLTSARSIIAIAGPPGGGKSLFATQLSELLNIENPGCAAVIPVDGFHYDDAVLTEWKILDRKGSPGTFDVGVLIFTEN